jgi:hypothetical protein
MKVIQITEGHWRLEFFPGLGLDVIMLHSSCLAFVSQGGSLLFDTKVGQA